MNVERDLSALGETHVKLEASTQLRAAPDTCPACGAREVMWGFDFLQTKQRSEIHGVVWHDTKWMANSYICRTCWAGWIEPDDRAPITWVRPYWRV